MFPHLLHFGYTSDGILPSVLRSAQSNITTNTYNMLTRVHTWPAFSNHTVGDGGSTSNSLEAIHDSIHVDVGGNGQMGDPAVAGGYTSRSVTFFSILIFINQVSILSFTYIMPMLIDCYLCGPL